MIESLKKAIVFRLEENLKRTLKCVDLLDESDLWLQPNQALNSIGNLILHLNGNITQYILSGLGGQPDQRIRDQEFDPTNKMEKSALIKAHSAVVSKAITIINSLSDADFREMRTVQGFEMNGVDIIVHVAEHYSYHVGQIAFCVKFLKNIDLGFYRGINLNQKNL